MWFDSVYQYWIQLVIIDIKKTEFSILLPMVLKMTGPKSKILSQTLTFMQNWNVLVQSFNIWKRCFTLMAHKFLKLNGFFLMGQILHLKLKQVHFYRKSLQKNLQKLLEIFLISLGLALLSTHGGTNLFLSLSNQLKLEILPENMSSQLRFLKIAKCWFVKTNFQPNVLLKTTTMLRLKYIELEYRL